LEAIHNKEGFSYLRVRKAQGNEEWVALVGATPKVGQDVVIEEQAVLTDFHSKSLNRVFGKIIFGAIK
jgi:hypothetical protein